MRTVSMLRSMKILVSDTGVKVALRRQVRYGQHPALGRPRQGRGYEGTAISLSFLGLQEGMSEIHSAVTSHPWG